MLISEPSLDLIKQEVLSELKPLVLKLDLEKLSTFNRGYLSYQKDPFKMFVLNEIASWNKIIDFYNFRRGVDCKGILDIGTFIPFYPVVLKKIGYQVEVVEKINLYGKAYKPILEYLNLKDIRVHDIDIIKEDVDDLPKGYDVLLIAILEHLNGSPRMLIDKIKLLMGKNSLLYILVPNICKLSSIINILRGKSLLPLYENYYFSLYPFEGHNREMTLDELLLLCKYSSLEVVGKGYFNLYDKSNGLQIKQKILNIIKKVFPKSKYSDLVYVITRK